MYDENKPTPENYPAVSDKKTPEIHLSFRQNLSKLILTPAVFTALITVVVGPFSVGLINNFIKNKEIDTERKKKFIELQAQLMTKVFDYTNSADFNLTSSITKMEFMTKMLDENRDIFELQFANTVRTIDAFYNHKEELITANTQGHITDLQTKVSNDSVKLMRLKTDEENLLARKHEMEVKLQGQVKSHEINEGQMDAQLRELADSIRLGREKIEGLSQSIESTKDNIALLNRENVYLKDQVRAKEENLLKSTRTYREVIDRDSILIGEKENSIISLKAALENTRNKLTDALSTMEELRSNANILEQKAAGQQITIDSLSKAAKVALIVQKIP